METPQPKEHWDKIYQHKSPEEVSWTQEVPAISLNLIRHLNLPKTAAIIDVGGGDSKLVDNLLDEGYTDISVLDISQSALERAQQRLGSRASQISWIVSDITCFKPQKSYDLWHDRAAFHFLTGTGQTDAYLRIARNNIKPGGHLIIGTFSTEGPEKCSGLHIRQYSEGSLGEMFRHGFQKEPCLTTDHITPFGSSQNFLFCTFRRIKND